MGLATHQSAQSARAGRSYAVGVAAVFSFIAGALLTSSLHFASNVFSPHNHAEGESTQSRILIHMQEGVQWAHPRPTHRTPNGTNGDQERLQVVGAANGTGAGAEPIQFGRNSIVADPVDPPSVPTIAYLIGGAANDSMQMLRLLQAVYHPRNEYILHLEESAAVRARLALMLALQENAVYRRFNNVYLIPDPILVSYRGPTMIAVTLQGMALALRRRPDFDWFINLSAADYPLMPQDDLLYVFSHVPRDLNFLYHSDDMKRVADSRARSVVVDAALSLRRKGWDYTGYKRRFPTRFNMFRGSAWMMVTRAFAEHVVMGSESLPRVLLLYFANSVSSPEAYFHTVACNTPAFMESVVNSDLHFIHWPKYRASTHPDTLSMKLWEPMLKSGAVFARKMPREGELLDRIDRDLLSKPAGGASWGQWCSGPPDLDNVGYDPCERVGDNINALRPTTAHERLLQLLQREFDKEHIAKYQCVNTMEV